jgi:hypothetical protein
MQLIRTLVLLLIHSSWVGDSSVVVEGFQLHSPLVRCIRASDLWKPATTSKQNWVEWASSEADRRTIFLAFCMLNVQTIAYNRPPALLAREVPLSLPCSSDEWQATTEAEWAVVRQANGGGTVNLQSALKSLVTADSSDWGFLPCAFTNMVLLHGLIQRIYLARQLSFEAFLDGNYVDEIQ